MAENDFRGWQPIETAPKEKGSGSILVWCPERWNIYLVIWWENKWAIFGGGGDILREEPTHWMPRPSPPGEAVPRGTSEYVNKPTLSAKDRALKIAFDALMAIDRQYDSAFARDELARIRILVPEVDE